MIYFRLLSWTKYAIILKIFLHGGGSWIGRINGPSVAPKPRSFGPRFRPAAARPGNGPRRPGARRESGFERSGINRISG